MGRRRRKKNPRARFFRRLILLGLILAAVWVRAVVWFVDQVPRDVVNTSTQTDTIIILTGGSLRMQTGIELLEQGLTENLFVSGVGEGADMDTLLILSGMSLPDNIAELKPYITLGYEAVDTESNAIETAEWVRKKGYKSLRLVTANYHTPRSLVEFERYLPDTKIIPHPIAVENVILEKWWEHPGSKRLLISEFHKYVATQIRSLLGL